MAERQGIEIDYCPQCRGVWLDRGELDKIIERNMAGPASQPQVPTYRDHDPKYDDRRGRHGQSRHYSERGSWLRDLFD